MSDNSAIPINNDWNIAENQDMHEDPLLDCLIILTKMYGRNISKASLSAGSASCPKSPHSRAVHPRCESSRSFFTDTREDS